MSQTSQKMIQLEINYLLTHNKDYYQGFVMRIQRRLMKMYYISPIIHFVPRKARTWVQGDKVEVTLLIPPSELPGEAVPIILITLGGSGSYH